MNVSRKKCTNNECSDNNIEKSKGKFCDECGHKLEEVVCNGVEVNKDILEYSSNVFHVRYVIIKQIFFLLQCLAFCSIIYFC